MTFGERLQECIKNKGCTQRELADKLNISPARLNSWVKDKRQPDVEYIKRLAAALNVSGDYLVGTMDILKRKVSHLDQLLLKYEQLDEHGRYVVDTILDIEYERCTADNTDEE